MRLLVTADLHYNHPRSRRLAEELIDRMNEVAAAAAAAAAEPIDALLVVGDTAPAESDELAACLARFTFDGPRLFVAGNHELWTRGADSHALLREVLPRRLADLGWHDLQSAPYVHAGGLAAVVGSIGWYDYAFAPPSLGLPRRFYEAKASPASAAQDPALAHLVAGAGAGGDDDVPAHAARFLARWNDGRFVRLGRSDEAFLDELLAELRGHLAAVAGVPHVLAAIHHLPFAELLPAEAPSGGLQWAFARAYLGSPRLGALLLEHPNVRTVVCGHSHLPAEADVGHIRAINVGSGYRGKAYRLLDVGQ